MINTTRKTNIFVLILFIYQIVAANVFGVIIAFLPVPVSTGGLLLISQIICFALPCWVVLLMERRRIDEILPDANPGAVNCLLIVVMVMLIQPAMMILSGLSSMIFNNDISVTVADMLGESGLAGTLLLVAFVPAVCEEVAMRGIVLSGSRDVKLLTAALLNGLFFGLVHFSFQQFAYAALLGFIFCYFVRYTRSIFSSMLAHFVLNASQTLLSYVSVMAGDYEAAVEQYALFGMDVSPDVYGIAMLVVPALICTPIFLWLFRLFRRRNSHNLEPVPVAAHDGRGARPLNWAFWLILAVYAAYMVLLALATRLVETM